MRRRPSANRQRRAAAAALPPAPPRARVPQTVEYAERRVGVAGRRGAVRQHDRRRQRGGSGQGTTALPARLPRSRGSSNCRTTPHATRAPTPTREPPQRRRCAPAPPRAPTSGGSFFDTRRPLHDDHPPRTRGHLVDRAHITPSSRSRSWSRPIMPGRESMAAHARAPNAPCHTSRMVDGSGVVTVDESSNRSSRA